MTRANLRARLVRLRSKIKGMPAYPFALLNVNHAIDCLDRGNYSGVASWMQLATRRMKNHDSI